MSTQRAKNTVSPEMYLYAAKVSSPLVDKNELRKQSSNAREAKKEYYSEAP
jgi:hypothetical protein